MEAATQANRARRTRRRPTLNFTNVNSQQRIPNRNNTAFKIPANSMKIKAEPNSNRNKNSATAHAFTDHGAPATNHKSRLTNQANSGYNQASICAPPQSNSCTNRAIIKASKGKVA
jgi:hypothetical protein